MEKTKEKFTYFYNEAGTYSVVFELNTENEMICGEEKKEPLAKEMTRRLNVITADIQKQLSDLTNDYQRLIDNSMEEKTIYMEEISSLKEQLRNRPYIYSQDELDTEPPHVTDGKFIELKKYEELKEQLREANEKAKNLAANVPALAKDNFEQSALISELVGALEEMINYSQSEYDYNRYETIITKAKQFTNKEGGKG